MARQSERIPPRELVRALCALGDQKRQKQTIGALWSDRQPRMKKAPKPRGSRCFRGIFLSGQGRGRTADTGIFSPVLYQLSYLTGP